MTDIKQPEANDGLVSLDKVRARYDIRAAIIRELGKIPKGKLISEMEFCLRTAGADRNRFRRCVENSGPEFEPNRIKLRLNVSDSDGKFFWGRAEDIAEAKRLRDE